MSIRFSTPSSTRTIGLRPSSAFCIQRPTRTRSVPICTTTLGKCQSIAPLGTTTPSGTRKCFYITIRRLLFASCLRRASSSALTGNGKLSGKASTQPSPFGHEQQRRHSSIGPTQGIGTPTHHRDHGAAANTFGMPKRSLRTCSTSHGIANSSALSRAARYFSMRRSIPRRSATT